MLITGSQGDRQRLLWARFDLGYAQCWVDPKGPRDSQMDSKQVQYLSEGKRVDKMGSQLPIFNLERQVGGTVE